MKYITKLKLAAVHQSCSGKDESTEYMLQLMQDLCRVDLDTCLKYLELHPKQHLKLFKELTSLTKVILVLSLNKK